MIMVLGYLLTLLGISLGIAQVKFFIEEQNNFTDYYSWQFPRSVEDLIAEMCTTSLVLLALGIYLLRR